MFCIQAVSKSEKRFLFRHILSYFEHHESFSVFFQHGCPMNILHAAIFMIKRYLKE